MAHGHAFSTTPADKWQAAVRRATDKVRQRLEFMTADHHVVRNFVVKGLAQFQRPLSLAEIATHVHLPTSYLQVIVEELERNLFFLVRNRTGNIEWAFPLTADRTAHHLKLSTGQYTFGACAEDAFAAAFVLGRLLHRSLRVDIQSVCAQSGRPLRLIVSSDLSWRAHSPNVDHLLFVPSIDWETFRAPSIINDY